MQFQGDMSSGDIIFGKAVLFSSPRILTLLVNRSERAGGWTEYNAVHCEYDRDESLG